MDSLSVALGFFHCLPRYLMKFSISSRSLGTFVMMMGSVVFCGLFSSCGSGGGGLADTGYGPFDSRGNYVEAWADNPSKWNRRSMPKDSSPVEDPAPVLLASNDSPPSNLTPISTSTSAREVEVSRMKPSSSSSRSTVAKTTTKPKSTSTASTSSKPKSSSSVAKTSSKSKAVAAKPKSSRVVVKKGDTLSGLAARHSSSVSAIQRANGMRDTKLAIGRSLVIPRL